MAPIDGAIGLKLNICNAYTTDVNISKGQPSKASGLGGVRSPRSKCAPIYYLDKIESLNFGRRVLGNGRAEYEVDYTTG